MSACKANDHIIFLDLLSVTADLTHKTSALQDIDGLKAECLARLVSTA